MDERTATALMLAEENLRRGEVIHHAIIDTHSRVMKLERKLDWLIDILKNQTPSCEKNPTGPQPETGEGELGKKE